MPRGRGLFLCLLLWLPGCVAVSLSSFSSLAVSFISVTAVVSVSARRLGKGLCHFVACAPGAGSEKGSRRRGTLLPSGGHSQPLLNKGQKSGGGGGSGQPEGEGTQRTGGLWAARSSYSDEAPAEFRVRLSSCCLGPEVLESVQGEAGALEEALRGIGPSGSPLELFSVSSLEGATESEAADKLSRFVMTQLASRGSTSPSPSPPFGTETVSDLVSLSVSPERAAVPLDDLPSRDPFFVSPETAERFLEALRSLVSHKETDLMVREEREETRKVYRAGKLLVQEPAAVNHLAGQSTFSEALKGFAEKFKGFDSDPCPAGEIRSFLQEEFLRPRGMVLEDVSCVREALESEEFAAALAERLRGMLRWFKERNPYYRGHCLSCGGDAKRFLGASLQTAWEASVLGFVGGEGGGLEGKRGSSEQRGKRRVTCELYECEADGCGCVFEFPRLVETRDVWRHKKGRCGEYSRHWFRVFEALGFKTRWVVDWDDHVWVEIWLPLPPRGRRGGARKSRRGKAKAEDNAGGTVSEPGERVSMPGWGSEKEEKEGEGEEEKALKGGDEDSGAPRGKGNAKAEEEEEEDIWEDGLFDEEEGGRWVHVDPCEASVDEPLIYESWGKKPAYVMAFGRGGAEDVTRRYTTAGPRELRRRRKVPSDRILSLLKKVNGREEEALVLT
uniref:Uncharacterized protein n=1 Tax=Chromera velia CCMP2878 TaxID=1169474 RepID=A0A0G4FLB5_9ALVE|eukprot:Cvel_17617.t1-p1 / transcript=Cvel_17617.t1 / gene=Cvel_17617 / organism=Chromera_velia_CCMP2878 / gene_product=none, putative / transcript_product=none, putative / location=Cvel_scaffold1417:13995-17137(+) / protein_length=671 / sequence_SO=supercontig / SO=protein_coding / is_pseudo=false